ncbi:major tail protein [Mycobacterium phage Indlulamithi]|uniref:Major tail protein n=1 Tax=Mycobacterium phage Indlulamithi TaxID=2656582 RepID=A0A649VDN2_9CAUD|nr:major tail protein [Mycobacterium phage Indlulamithi]QGJ90062.1 major tail protein [Mycobacterium phage Indlulamithi]
MTAPVPVALPFGMRDVKIYPYLDANGTILAEEGYDLPNAQTFSFADSEDFTDLRGDDELVATHGNGAQVNWTLEAGGIALQVWAIFTGGQIIETGTAPNRKITLRKLSDDVRPYFKVVGQILSESGGDVQGIVYRAKCNGDISGQFGDGQFFVTSADGIGLSVPGTKLLYDIVQNETRTFLSTTPTANPIMPPRNIGLTAIGSTTAGVQWEPVSAVTGYSYRLSDDGGDTWDAPVENPDNTVDLTALTADTDYLIQVRSKVGTDYGAFGQPIAFSTTPA